MEYPLVPMYLGVKVSGIDFIGQLVVNTVQAQHHHCKTAHEDGIPPSPNVPRSKGKWYWLYW